MNAKELNFPMGSQQPLVACFAAHESSVESQMKILSWNVNGIRACVRKGFREWFDESGADIVGLQEVRARHDQVPEEVVNMAGWEFNLVEAERGGYSGVGLLSRHAPDSVITSMEHDEYDAEGRLQIATFGNLVLANVYFPNGSGKNRDNSRVPFKIGFYQRLYDMLAELNPAERPILVMGDFNTAHKEIDLARPKSNKKTSGFLPEEREELDRWIRSGWEDTFRTRCGEGEHYTWWSQRFGVREKNVGWRIDYVLASPAASPFIRSAFTRPNDRGSDHCPIGVEVDPAILTA
jgi:exodeoxyribonuclease-3